MNASAVPDQTVTAVGIAAASLFALLAGVQLSLALGAPFGDLVWGGRFEAQLSPGLRAASALAAVVLVGAALVVLARSGALGWSPLPARILAPVTWAVAAYMVLNTLGNLMSQTVFERWALGSATAALAVLCAVVAHSGPGPS